MNAAKVESARSLAAYHSNYDPEVLQVIRLDAANEEMVEEPIKLLEINASSVPCGIVPVYFGPSSLVPFASVVIEVTPDEFQQIQAKLLPLPDGWCLGEVLFSRNGHKGAA